MKANLYMYTIGMKFCASHFIMIHKQFKWIDRRVGRFGGGGQNDAYPQIVSKSRFGGGRKEKVINEISSFNQSDEQISLFFIFLNKSI